MATPQVHDLAHHEHEQHHSQQAPQDSQAGAEPGVGQLVSQIQHIIKDSAGPQSSRPQSSGYSSPQESASLVPGPPAAEEAKNAQHSQRQAHQEHSAAGFEDGMSEISISEPASEASKGSNAPGLGLKPRLSAPRRSLQPPTSPFASDADSFEDAVPSANGQLDNATKEVHARDWLHPITF